MGLFMHEISLVRNVFNTLKAEFPEKIDSIKRIYLTVGVLSNIQPLLMQSAFDAVLIDEPQYKNASLQVDVLPIKVYCDDCKVESEVSHYKFICLQCQKPSKNVIQGEEMLITKVEFEN
jgi:hydrogenase nickel incorporation protein HypA/HybF